MRPIIPLKETTKVERGDHKPPRCKHGVWRFAGASYKHAEQVSGVVQKGSAHPPRSGDFPDAFRTMLRASPGPRVRCGSRRRPSDRCQAYAWPSS